MWDEWPCRMLQVLVFRRRNEPRFWFLFSKWEHSLFQCYLVLLCLWFLKHNPHGGPGRLACLLTLSLLSSPCPLASPLHPHPHTLKQRLPWWSICRVTNGSLELWRRIRALCIKRALGLPNYNQDSPATHPLTSCGGKGVLLIVLRSHCLRGDGWRGGQKSCSNPAPFFSTFRTAVMRNSV